MNPEQRIRNYIAKHFFFGDPQDLNGSDSLLDSGVVDSTGVMELILFLESEFGIQMADNELVPENLDSVDRMAAFVAQKLVEGSSDTNKAIGE